MAAELFQFQTVSEAHDAPEPFIVKVVPPTQVMLVLSTGALAWLEVSSSLAAGVSVVVAGGLKKRLPLRGHLLEDDCQSLCGPPPQVQEELNCLARLSLAMRLKIELGLDCSS